MAEIIPIEKAKGQRIVQMIKEGAIFIYPTDTIYGIGCNALLPDAVNRIRAIKQRTDKPFSVIAPSKQWILKNFKVKKIFVDKLPGPFTYILMPKNSLPVCAEVSNIGTLGVRIPDHKFTKVIQKAKVPFVTTSVNISGEAPAIDMINYIKEKPE